MSPGSGSGRGAMTLTPAPNGAKGFNIVFNFAAGIEHGALDACPLRSSSRSTRPLINSISMRLLVHLFLQRNARKQPSDSITTVANDHVFSRGNEAVAARGGVELGRTEGVEVQCKLKKQKLYLRGHV